MENVNGHNEKKFDAYILGTMPDHERVAFAARLAEDNELHAQFKDHERAIAGIRHEGREAMRADLEKIHHKKDRRAKEDHGGLKTAKVFKLKSLLSWGIAAGILLLVGIWFFKPANQSENLLAQYYQPYTLKVGLRDNGGQEALLQIDDLYAKADYVQVVPLLSEYLKTHPSENTLRLALAISLFENKKTEAAMAELQVIEKSSDPLLMDQVNWYSALMLIERGKLSQAKKLLKPLAENSEADHHQSAVELLAKMH